MKTDCGIIRDLLPLYAEDMCSTESRAAVEQHLPGCADCQAALENIKKDTPIAPVDALPFKALSHKLRRSRWRMAAFAVAVVLMLATGTLYHITNRQYARFSPGLARAEMAADGRVKVTGLGATGIDTSVVTSPDETSAKVYITYFNVNPNGAETTSYISVPKGATPSVYYVYPNEVAVLLLGPPDGEGSFALLPRIAPLSFNLLGMIGLLILTGALAIAMRHKPNIRQVLKKIILIPIAYITAHLIIKGMDTTSWDLMRDLCYILAVMVFNIAVMWLAPKQRERHEL